VLFLEITCKCNKERRMTSSMEHFDQRTWKFPHCKFTLHGHSRSAHSTCFFIPELGWALDGGLPIHKDVDYVFVTHGHLDHSFNIPFMLSRKQVMNVFVPPGTAHFFQNFMVSSFKLNDATDDIHDRHYTINTAETNVMFEIGGHQKYTMRAINCVHSVPCVGYYFYEKRTKLKEEYRAMSGAEIGKLRKSGVDVSEHVDFPLFAYLGDTTTEVFEKNPDVFSFPVIITECTFLGESYAEEAVSRGHTCWTTLFPYVQKNPQITFVLIHFSLRYSNNEILKFFESFNLKNIVVWVDPEPDAK